MKNENESLLLKLKKIIAMTAEKVGATIENADCQALATEIDKHFILVTRIPREFFIVVNKVEKKPNAIFNTFDEAQAHINYYHETTHEHEIIYVQEKEKF